VELETVSEMCSDLGGDMRKVERTLVNLLPTLRKLPLHCLKHGNLSTLKRKNQHVPD